MVSSIITGQKNLLKTLVEKIGVDDEKVKMYYTIIVPFDSIVAETSGVLPFLILGLKERDTKRRVEERICFSYTTSSPFLLLRGWGYLKNYSGGER